ncbi:MAG: DUF2318 domain-containing protein [Deltaproteobacteria bacterium]|jgi:uncharacterized membrane protein|nr:DUF2318 domain-containing protein [Deltaproteobacteria bacterium]
MLSYLIKVIDESWLLALVAPLVLRIINHPKKIGQIGPVIYCGFGLGLLAALILSTLRLNVGWIIREYYDLSVLIPAILSLLCFGAFRLGVARDDKQKYVLLGRSFLALIPTLTAVYLIKRLAGPGGFFGAPALVLFFPALSLFSFGPLKIVDCSKASKYCAALFLAAMTARTTPNLMLFPFEFGVGLDSVFNREYLDKVLGYSIGLLLASLLWLLVHLLIKSVSIKALKWIAIFTLSLAFLELCLEIGQILAARRLLPNFLFKAVLFLLIREHLFLWVQSLGWTILAFYLIIQSYLVRPIGSNAALRRKSMAKLYSDRRRGIAALLCLFVIIFSATALRALNERGPYIEEPLPIKSSGSKIVLDLQTVADGKLHRYSYETQDGTKARFIVIKKSQTAFGAGLDACDICGQSGYYQKGEQVICKLCDVVMNKSTIGFPGGCNPVPLDFTFDKGSIIFETDDLETEAHRFK